jgi:hypothetical protein
MGANARRLLLRPACGRTGITRGKSWDLWDPGPRSRANDRNTFRYILSPIKYSRVSTTYTSLVSMDDQPSQRAQYWDPEIYLSDMEILDAALQHDLPIFVSIDGSFDDEGVACTTISVLAPDIRDTNMINSNAWQNRLAKVLLICSWRLPTYWGTGTAGINMAEAIGFILGEYTIPADLPIIYITDSNNARTLQRNIVNLKKFTHRKKSQAGETGY